jgi:NADPH-dependent glutamate synthase beta subunit-like oxidoreductase
VEIGDRVIVIGGGDTAIDAARVSHKLGAQVTVLYRRTRAEMPAIKPEIEGALEEGVEIEYLAAPVEILRNNGRAVGMRCLRMDLGEPDKSGRRRPVPRPGSEFDVPATSIIAAISQEPDFEALPELHEGKDWVKADSWGNTPLPGVFSGGDDIGLGLVSIAIGQGRFAAEAIDARLRGTTPEKPAAGPPITTERMKPGWYKENTRHEREHLPADQRQLETEIEQGLSADEALEEARRCMSCGMCMDCETCWMYCTNSAFVKLPKGEHYRIKLELCNGCKKCAEECPCGYIELV